MRHDEKGRCCKVRVKPATSNIIYSWQWLRSTALTKGGKPPVTGTEIPKITNNIRFIREWGYFNATIATIISLNTAWLMTSN